MGTHHKKLEHVILFFLERINNVQLGATKLMKLLYYVDFDHYEQYGKPVTNAKYRKLPHGPVPDEAEKVIKNMITTGAVEAVKQKVGKFEQHRLITKAAQFDPSLFTGDELETLKQVACRWEHHTAKEIEAATHKEVPWASTQDGKSIDYELAEYRTPLPEDEPVDDFLASSDSFKKYVAGVASN